MYSSLYCGIIISTQCQLYELVIQQMSVACKCPVFRTESCLVMADMHCIGDL